jgi:integrase
MAVEPLNGKRGKSWKVRYRDHSGIDRAETYTVELDALHRDTQIKQAKARREPIPVRGRGDGGLTFERFAYDVWWPNFVVANNRAFKTQEQYSILLDNHLIPCIGSDAITFIDVPRAITLKTELAKAKTPEYTLARSLKLFRQIMGFAVTWGSVKENPGIIFSERGALPPQGRKEDVKPLWPTETEAIRAAMQARKSPFKLRDAVLVSVMAYAGLRPMEALALCWGGVGEDSLRIQKAKAKRGSFKPRTVPKLIRPLMDDLAQWRDASSSTGAKALVFPAENGHEWSRSAYGSWRARVWDSCAPDDASPYDCRHGYASLLAREGIDIAEGAKRMGHSVAMHVQHYTHVFEAHRDQPNEPMEAVVLKARGA